MNGDSPLIRMAAEIVAAEVLQRPSWAQKLLRYVLVCVLVSSVINSSCYTDYDFIASLNQLFLQDANGRKHTRDGTTSWLAHAGHEIQTLYVQDSLIAFLVTSLLMSPADSMNSTVPSILRAVYNDSPHWLLASHLSCMVSISSSPRLIFMALTLSFKFSIRAPVCWYIHDLSSYSLLDATYALHPTLVCLAPLPIIIKNVLSCTAPLLAIISPHIRGRCTITHIRLLPHYRRMYLYSAAQPQDRR